MARSPSARPYDAAAVFDSALHFQVTCNYLQSVDIKAMPEVVASVTMPIVALSALTIELLLKTLHAMHSDNPVPGHHNLANLYKGLDSGTRRAIQGRWETIFQIRSARWEQIRVKSGAKRAPVTNSVVDALEDGSLAFERFRYSFERNANKLPDFYIDDLRNALVRLILERRPEWQMRQPTLGPLVPWDDPAPQSNHPKGGTPA